MAYHSTSGLANNSLDMLGKLKTFLTETCGWTLHDDGMAQTQPFFVTASHGESGKEDIYLQFIRDGNADMISTRGALYWDNVSHTPVKEAYYGGVTGFRTRDSSQFLYWIFANLDRVFIVTKIVSTYFGHYSGLIKRFWSDKIAVTQAQVGLGSNVVIPVDDASLFSVGKPYLIKDNANIERVMITAVDTVSTPNTVTAASLVKGYYLGAKIGADPQPVIVGRTQNPGSFYSLNKFDGYAGASSQSGTTSAGGGSHLTNSDPDCRYGLTAMFPWLVGHSSASYKEFRGELIEVYSIGGSSSANEDVLDLGSATYKLFYLDSCGWTAIRE